MQDYNSTLDDGRGSLFVTKPHEQSSAFEQGEREKNLVSSIIRREQDMYQDSIGYFKLCAEAEELMNKHLNVDKYTASLPFMAVRDIAQKLKPVDYDIIPKKLSNTFAARVMYKALNGELEKSGYRLEFIKSANKLCTYGESYQLLEYYISDIDNYNGISIETFSPTEVLIDDKQRQFSSMTGKGDAVDMIFKYTLSYEDFRDMTKDPKNITIDGKSYPMWKDAEYVIPGLIKDGTSSTSNTSTEVEMWGYYNRVTDTQGFMAGANRIIVKDMPLVTRRGKRKVLPATQRVYYPIVASNRYQGIPMIIRNDEQTVNMGMRLGLEHAINMGKTMTFINESIGAEVDRLALARRDPFVSVNVPISASIDQFLTQHQMNPLGAEYYNLVSEILPRNVIAKVGSDFNMLNQEPKHASTFLGRADFIDAMIKRIMEYNELQAERDFLMMCMSMMIDFFDKKKWQQLLDKDMYDQLIEHSGGNIKKYLSDNTEYADLEIASGSIVEPNRAARKQSLTEALQYTQPGSPEANAYAAELTDIIAPSRSAEILIQKDIQATQMRQGAVEEQGGGNRISTKKPGATTQSVVQSAIQPALREGAKNKSGQ